MPRSFLSDWTKQKHRPPQVSKRGPRVERISFEEQFPYLGAHTSRVESRLAAALDQRGIPYRAQVVVGVIRESPGRGRTLAAGGQVVDFYLPVQRKWVRVQGNYWHSKATAMARDDAQKVALMAKYPGIQVIDVWEDEIMRNVDLVIRTMIGTGIPR